MGFLTRVYICYYRKRGVRRADAARPGSRAGASRSQAATSDRVPAPEETANGGGRRMPRLRRRAILERGGRRGSCAQACSAPRTRGEASAARPGRWMLGSAGALVLRAFPDARAEPAALTRCSTSRRRFARAWPTGCRDGARPFATVGEHRLPAVPIARTSLDDRQPASSGSPRRARLH